MKGTESQKALDKQENTAIQVLISHPTTDKSHNWSTKPHLKTLNANLAHPIEKPSQMELIRRFQNKVEGSRVYLKEESSKGNASSEASVPGEAGAEFHRDLIEWPVIRVEQRKERLRFLNTDHGRRTEERWRSGREDWSTIYRVLGVRPRRAWITVSL